MSDNQHISNQDGQGEPEFVELTVADLAESARGSLAAHRKLRDDALKLMRLGAGDTQGILVAAEIFARMAASFDDPQDRMMLSAILCYRVEFVADTEENHAIVLAQAVDQLDAAVDSSAVDDTRASTSLEMLAQAFPKAIFDLSKTMRASRVAA